VIGEVHIATLSDGESAKKRRHEEIKEREQAGSTW